MNRYSTSGFRKTFASFATYPRTDPKEHPYGDRTSEEQLREWGQLPVDGSSTFTSLTQSNNSIFSDGRLSRTI